MPSREASAPGGRISNVARELAQRLGVDARASGERIRFRQRGRMRQDASSRWMKFRATQTISTRECEFDWRAKSGPLGLINVQDALTGGVGRLQVRALGCIPLARASGSPEVTRGELMRYLAELPWAPAAIVQNPMLRWRQEASDCIVVGAGDGETAAEVTFSLDGVGRIASTFASDRPRSVGKAFVRTPWRGRFLDYELHERMWLPRRAEVAWIVEGTEMHCFEGQIEDWTANRFS